MILNREGEEKQGERYGNSKHFPVCLLSLLYIDFSLHAVRSSMPLQVLGHWAVAKEFFHAFIYLLLFIKIELGSNVSHVANVNVLYSL